MNIKPVPVDLVGETLKSFAPLYILNTIASELPVSV
ncbi:hypothetical protein ABH968_000714 [Lysinibacillus sp. RC79]